MKNILLFDMDKFISERECVGLDEYAHNAARLTDRFYMPLSGYIEYLAAGENDEDKRHYDKYAKTAIEYIADCDGVIVAFDINRKYFAEACAAVGQAYEIIALTATDAETAEIDGVKPDSIVKVTVECI